MIYKKYTILILLRFFLYIHQNESKNKLSFFHIYNNNKKDTILSLLPFF